MEKDLQADAGTSRLATLLPLLESDPHNLALIADAAETALNEGQAEIAAELIDRYERIAPLPDQEINHAGLAARRLGRFDEATSRFETLIESGADDPGLCFNLAWARAMQKQFDRSLELLTEEVAFALPQAAMLKVQILHELGEFDQAIAHARDYLGRHSDYPPLLAAVSVLALDVGDEELAGRCARGAPNHPDALSTLGTLALGQDRASEALNIFDRALERNRRAPRAWVGRGLAKLLTGDSATAAEDIDRGAEMFGDHLGSWIAAGWAHFVSKDIEASRARFLTALELDPTFAESHGSLAVIDVLEGRVEEARQRSEVALRLDRNCYSAALARVLLASAAGDKAQAARIYELAVNTPVDESGRTIASALSRMGIGQH